MITRILLAYDGSEPADHAASFALDLARKYSASLSVLAVSRPPDIAEDVETRAIIETSQKHYHHLLGQLRHRLFADVPTITTDVKVGHPAEQIVKYAEQHSIDLIVMGHRGKSFFERWRLGSISQRVLSYAHCPVLIVR
jgi:nucleotide-binding universal stress UspA family protein